MDMVHIQQYSNHHIIDLSSDIIIVVGVIIGILIYMYFRRDD